MPSLRSGQMPTTIHTKSAEASKEHGVHFSKDPVKSILRPMNASESWACYHFEMHARKCPYCQNPYEVHRKNEMLCDVGHRLALELCRYGLGPEDAKSLGANSIPTFVGIYTTYLTAVHIVQSRKITKSFE